MYSMTKTHISIYVDAGALKSATDELKALKRRLSPEIDQIIQEMLPEEPADLVEVADTRSDGGDLIIEIVPSQIFRYILNCLYEEVGYDTF